MKKINLQELREKYKKGSKVVLHKMKGEPNMFPGLKGIIKYVDDIGQIHVAWDNGSSLALNLQLDTFTVIK